MTALTSIETKDEISIITLDDGKANAFSFEMITSLNESLAQVPIGTCARDSLSEVIISKEKAFAFPSSSVMIEISSLVSMLVSAVILNYVF